MRIVKIMKPLVCMVAMFAAALVSSSLAADGGVLV